MTRFDETDHAPVLKLKSNDVNVYHKTRFDDSSAAVAAQDRYSYALPSHWACEGHHHRPINDQYRSVKRGFSRKDYDSVVFLDSGNRTH